MDIRDKRRAEDVEHAYELARRLNRKHPDDWPPFRELTIREAEMAAALYGMGLEVAAEMADTWGDPRLRDHILKKVRGGRD